MLIVCGMVIRQLAVGSEMRTVRTYKVALTSTGLTLAIPCSLQKLLDIGNEIYLLDCLPPCLITDHDP
jgi:hypothetical protein